MSHASLDSSRSDSAMAAAANSRSVPGMPYSSHNLRHVSMFSPGCIAQSAAADHAASFPVRGLVTGSSATGMLPVVAHARWLMT
jgi:hypothetical protein